MTTANTNSDSSALTLGVGCTAEVGGVRFHRYMTSIVVTELANAGRRGKKCRELRIVAHTTHAEQNLDTYARILVTAASYECAKELAELFGTVSVHEDMLRGIDVEVGAIEFRHAEISGRIGPSDFCVKSTRDTDNEPTVIPSGRANTAALYAWAKANPSALARMNLRAFERKAQELGVATHHYCAID